MADLDYGELRVYPGNYDEYMTAATQARERLLADNAKKKAQIADLQSFVSRFSANASKSRQATSRARQIDKIKLEELKPPAVRTRSSASSRTRNCSVTRWKWKPLPKALMKVRCLKTSTCCWKWARRLPFWAPTAWVNPPC
jgi:ATPase subunit of ABC transporter with duplicated ATPase domains